MKGSRNWFAELDDGEFVRILDSCECLEDFFVGSRHVYTGAGMDRMVGDVACHFRGIRVEFTRRMVSGLEIVVFKYQLYSELYTIVKKLSKIAMGLFTLGIKAAARHRLSDRLIRMWKAVTPSKSRSKMIHSRQLHRWCFFRLGFWRPF